MKIVGMKIVFLTKDDEGNIQECPGPVWSPEESSSLGFSTERGFQRIHSMCGPDTFIYNGEDKFTICRRRIEKTEDFSTR